VGFLWLDAKAQSALFEFEADPPDSPIQVEFKDREGRMAAYLGSEDRPRRFKRPIRSEQPYSLSITGPEDTQVTVTVRGLLEPALLK